MPPGMPSQTMSDSLETVRHRIRNIEDLRSVVRTMKAMAAASINQFEQAAAAVAGYQRSVELALSLCLDREIEERGRAARDRSSEKRGLVVIGTDQGMAGQFNEHLVEAVGEWRDAGDSGHRLWVVGERAMARLENAGFEVEATIAAPQSVEAISDLVSRVLPDLERAHLEGEVGPIEVCHQAPVAGAGYEARRTALLPLDQAWRAKIGGKGWPTRQLPEMIADDERSFQALVSEFLFVALYRAFAESAAAENGARLAAMQRAERNIDERQRELSLDYNRHRQATIDEELFDLVAGYRSLGGGRK